MYNRAVFAILWRDFLWYNKRESGRLMFLKKDITCRFLVYDSGME
jgi:hypothetical protein